MRVYFDCGPFIDYLKFRTTFAESLRTASRHGRTPLEISKDLDLCLTRLKKKDNSGLTSTLAFVELDRALFGDLRKKAEHVTMAKSRYQTLTIRSMMEAVHDMCQFHGLEIVELRRFHIEAALADSTMKARRFSFADCLHLACAAGENAEAFLTVDDKLLRASEVFRNHKGDYIQIVDSDTLKGML